jgi:hypothetical protein
MAGLWIRAVLVSPADLISVIPLHRARDMRAKAAARGTISAGAD